MSTFLREQRKQIQKRFLQQFMCKTFLTEKCIDISITTFIPVAIVSSLPRPSIFILPAFFSRLSFVINHLSIPTEQQVK